MPKPNKIYTVSVWRSPCPEKPWQADTPPYYFFRPDAPNVCTHQIAAQTTAGAHAKAITACKRHTAAGCASTTRCLHCQRVV